MMAKKTFLIATMFVVGCYSGMDSELELGEREQFADEEVDEIVENLIAADYPEEEIEVLDDNTVLVGGDAVVTLDASREMIGLDSGDGEDVGFRQYRTNNLVNNGQTLTVIGYTANNSNGLDNTAQTALQWAVNNYNSLNIGLNFQLSYGTNYQDKDIVVYRVDGPGGGQAGFPSGGNPYKWVQIQGGTSNYGTNVVEHVIGHEIGHAIGLRHTDYFDRSLSCGSGGNEGGGSAGAIHIPGTPTGTDYNSLMQACFSASEDGEFGPEDIDALEFLY